MANNAGPSQTAEEHLCRNKLLPENGLVVYESMVGIHIISALLTASINFVWNMRDARNCLSSRSNLQILKNSAAWIAHTVDATIILK